MAKAFLENGENVVPIISSGIENLDMWKILSFERLIIIDTYNSWITYIIIDLVCEGGFFLFNPLSVDDIRSAIQKMAVMTTEERKKLGLHNLDKIRGFEKSEVNR